MARAALGWGVRDLSRIAKVSTDTVSRLERGEELKERTLDALAAVMEGAGIEFLPDNGVRLRPPPAPIRASSNPAPARKPRTAGKPAPRPPRAQKTPKAQAAFSRPMSKLEQIRALREQGAR